MKVFQFPLAKVIIPFVLGICTCYWLAPKLSWMLYSLFGTLLLFIFLYFLSSNSKNQTIFFGIVASILFFCLGSTTYTLHNDMNLDSNYLRKITTPTTPHSLEILVLEKLKNSTNQERYIGSVTTIDGQECTGKILINTRKETGNRPLKVGNSIVINGFIYPNRKPTNPNQFDYGAYLENKSINGYLFTSYNNIKILPKITKNSAYYSNFIRNKISTNLKKGGFGRNELPIINALILGQKQDISATTLKEYQYAGAIHILSVSGLHVGFILLFITFILKPLPNTKLGNSIRLVTILVSLWSFALVAGLSPSIVRAATMFTFVAIGMNLKRKTNIFHTLLVSLFLILLFVPSFLFDIGFQLSYLAVLFIVWLQPLLSAIWKPKNKIISYFWSITTLSFAAQIGTLPLSLYYFHQFPGLFFITNCVVIPLLSVLMAVGVLVMILALFDFVPLVPLAILEWLVQLLNRIISWIASFEEFIIKDISFSLSLLLCSYLLLLSSIFLIQRPTLKKSIFTLGILLISQLIFLITDWQTTNEKEWIVYHISKESMISERKGKNVSVYYSKNCNAISEKKSLLTPYLLANSSSIMHCEELSKNLYLFKDYKIEIIDSTAAYATTISPDILLLRDSPKVNLDRLVHLIKPKIIVADGSNFKSYVGLWKATCVKEKIPFHATGEKGFFLLK